MKTQLFGFKKATISSATGIAMMITTMLLMSAYSCFAQVSWTSVNTDAQGDVASGGTDGKELFYYYDAAADSLWFKVDIYATSNPSSNFGVNVMINIPGGGTTFNFWGTSNMAAYQKLVTAWVTGTAPSSYSGTIGIANASGIGIGNYTNLHNNNLDITFVSGASVHSIILGMPRTDLITDAEMGGNSVTVAIAAATGLSTAWQDDVYSPSGTMTFSKSSIGLEENNAIDIALYPNPTNGIFNLKSANLQAGSIVEIHNQIGQLIYTSAVQSISVNTIDISSAPLGVYLISIKNKEGATVYNNKLVKN